MASNMTCIFAFSILYKFLCIDAYVYVHFEIFRYCFVLECLAEIVSKLIWHER